MVTPSATTIRQRGISGVKWNMASQAGQQGAQLLTMAILTRLLAPADFGLVGMATIVIGFLNIFKDLGTSSAIIQQRDVSHEQLSSVFWANTTFGALAMVILTTAAPLLASYYHQPHVTSLLRVLALTFVVSGLGIVQQAIFERRLMFRTLARVEIAGVACGALVGIGSAIAGSGVWALVAQSLTTVTIVSVLLWYYSDWRPSPTFRAKDIGDISRYSLNLTGYSAFNYLFRNADNLLIGRYLGPTPLGLYMLAYRIMLYPLQSISGVISRVMFPIYSQFQNDDSRFRSAYLRSAGMIALVTFPMMTGVWVLAKPFTLAIFGPRWLPAVPLIMILAPVGMIQSIATTTGAIFQAKGRTDILFRWGLVTGLLCIAAFCIGLRWGVLGVATAYAIYSSGLVIPCFAIPFRLIGLRLHSLGAVLARPLGASALMAAAVFAVGHFLATWTPLPVLLMLVCTGVITYTTASWFINRNQLVGLISLVRGRS